MNYNLLELVYEYLPLCNRSKYVVGVGNVDLMEHHIDMLDRVVNIKRWVPPRCAIVHICQ